MLSKIFLSNFALPVLIDMYTDIRLLKILMWHKFDFWPLNQASCGVLDSMILTSDSERQFWSQFAWLIAFLQKIWDSLMSTSSAEAVLTNVWFKYSDISFCSGVYAAVNLILMSWCLSLLFRPLYSSLWSDCMMISFSSDWDSALLFQLVKQVFNVLQSSVR